MRNTFCFGEVSRFIKTDSLFTERIDGGISEALYICLLGRTSLPKRKTKILTTEVKFHIREEFRKGNWVELGPVGSYGFNIS